MKTEIKKLNRFTSLDVLLDLLKRKKLVLLDPSKWDDRNDTEVILAYKQKKNIEKLFALCFTHDSETIHHWKTFANGSSGCCIEFDAKLLLKIFDKEKLNHGKVNYIKINEATHQKFDIDEMPFIKRIPYKCEQEYRVIWEGKTDNNIFEFDVPLEAISKITISQQMPETVFNTIKDILKKTFSDPAKRISRSTIYENKKWIEHFKK